MRSSPPEPHHSSLITQHSPLVRLGARLGLPAGTPQPLITATLAYLGHLLFAPFVFSSELFVFVFFMAFFIALGRRGFRFLEVPARMREREAGRSFYTLSKSLYYPYKNMLASLMAWLRPDGRRRS